MQATYSLNSDELNVNFLNSIKEMFKNKNIDIIISDDLQKYDKNHKNNLDLVLKDYQENGDKNFIKMTDEFWKDSQKRLLERHKVS